MENMHKVRAAIYLRVSTEEHREGEVRSYERQRSGSANGINGLIQQHNLTVVHEFIEKDGTSASRQSTNARPQWEAALAGHGTVKTLEQLADLLGISDSGLSRTLNKQGGRRGFHDSQRFALASFLGITGAAINDILRRDAADNPERDAAWSELQVALLNIFELQTQMQTLVEQNKLLAQELKEVRTRIEEVATIASKPKKRRFL